MSIEFLGFWIGDEFSLMDCHLYDDLNESVPYVVMAVNENPVFDRYKNGMMDLREVIDSDVLD